MRILLITNFALFNLLLIFIKGGKANILGNSSPAKVSVEAMQSHFVPVMLEALSASGTAPLQV